MHKSRLLTVTVVLLLVALAITACKQPVPNSNLQPVTVVLDWTPNTNHTGLYVAKAKGYFAARGLDVNIILPGDAGAIQAVATGNADFGVSYQEEMTQARAQSVPAISIAAVIQHNTSGFASPRAKNIVSPQDFEGKNYGGWGSPVEEAIVETVMQTVGADPSKINFVSIGDVDFFTASQRDIDLAMIFYAWTGIEAELRDFPLNMIYTKDLAEELDYYTPLLITSESLAASKPQLVSDFLAAVTQGYQFAMEDPEAAAEILIAAEPDLDPGLVRASQIWLADKYQDDAPRWGEQRLEVWSRFAEWMFNQGLLENEVNVEQAFSNEFLPGNE